IARSLRSNGAGSTTTLATDDTHDEVDTREVVPRVAIVGRPNAGKSSLVNRLLGEEKQLVDTRPGTTVDSIDSLLEWKSARLLLVDTAGVRRKRSVEGSVEMASVLQALRAIERSDVVILVIDAHERAATQDARIAGLVQDRGCGLIVALNKADLMPPSELSRARRKARDVLQGARWAPLATVSAKTGQGVEDLLPLAQRILR